MKFTSPTGKTYEVNPAFGHALKALGWTSDEPTPHEPSSVSSDATEAYRSAWKKDDWSAHAESSGINVDGMTVAQIKAAVSDFEK